MNKIIAAILIVLGLGFVGMGVFFWWQSKKPTAGLKIESTPEALVFVDNVQIGQTPVEKIFIPGEVSVKLVPTASTSALASYQTKVKLTAQTYTVIKRDFAATDLESAGEIISLEPQSLKTASLAVVTASPESAAVTLDGQPQGFTPLLTSSILPGDHEITVDASGFKSRKISAKAVAGYKLTVNVKLAGQPLSAFVPEPTPEPSATPSATLRPTPEGFVTIKENLPKGFLRVREKATTASKEIGRVKSGEKYKMLDTIIGWYQILVDFEATTSGWISSQYASKPE